MQEVPTAKSTLKDTETEYFWYSSKKSEISALTAVEIKCMGEKKKLYSKKFIVRWEFWKVWISGLKGFSDCFLLFQYTSFLYSGLLSFYRYTVVFCQSIIYIFCAYTFTLVMFGTNKLNCMHNFNTCIFKSFTGVGGKICICVI